MQTYGNPQVDVPLTNVEVTNKEVLVVLLSLKPDSSSSKDGFLKSCTGSMVGPLSEMMRMSLTMGMVPKRWKKAMIVPLHKKGIKFSPINYRSINFLSALGKCLKMKPVN